MKCCQEIKVSIIMPSLNVAPYIRECIDSAVKSYGYQVNMGIQAAKGEYIAVLETDDYVDTMM